MSQLSRRFSGPQSQGCDTSEPANQTYSVPQDEPYLPCCAEGNAEELDARTDQLNRESAELQRTLSGWGADCTHLLELAKTAAKEHSKSIGLRGHFRSPSSRRLHARQEHRTAQAIHKISVERSQRTLEDKFVSGHITVDEFEETLAYLHHMHRLPARPSHSPATTFGVQRQSPHLSTFRSSSTSTIASSADSLSSPPQPVSRPPPLRSIHSEDTVQLYTFQRNGNSPRFFIANPSPTSSTSELNQQQ